MDLRRRARRIGVAIVIALGCASRTDAQSTDLLVAFTAEPNRVATDGLLTATLTVTNRGPEVEVLAGIYDTGYAPAVKTGLSPGLQLIHAINCFVEPCSQRYEGFRTQLASGSSAVLSLTLHSIRPPGGTFPITSFVAKMAPSYVEIFRASRTIAVAGSGPIPSAPAMLFGAGFTPTPQPFFNPQAAVFDPVNRAHLVTGADSTSDIVAGLDVAGVLLGAPTSVYTPPGPYPYTYGSPPDIAYSPDLGTSAPRGGVMVTWSEADTHVYAEAILSSGLTTNRMYLGEGESPRIAYSHTSRQFFVEWFGPNRQLLSRRVGLDAQPISPMMELLHQTEFGILDGVTWNSVSDEFGLLGLRITGSSSPEDGSLQFLRIAPDGSVLSQTKVAVGFVGRALLAVNSRSGEYVAIWNDGGEIYGAEISADGRVVSRGLVAPGSRMDFAASMGFNSISETFLVLGTAGSAFRPAVLELNQFGAPLAGPINLDGPIVNPVVSTRSDAAEWRVIGTIDPRSAFNPLALGSVAVRTLSAYGGSQARLGGCTTPDPFSAFGGSACYDGGWLPPGVPAPGTSIEFPGGCQTPDPFVALGGGTCLSGGWFPPSAPSPPPTPSPTPTPTPTPGGCTTPDPFVALGGGTCVNGGWYPPGMGAPAPPSPPPTPGGCITPDPFVALGGGRCINGGWYPPGMGSSVTPR